MQHVLNKDKAMLPKGDNKSKSFDGIQLAVDGAERCDIPRHFACCKQCYAAAQDAEHNNVPCRLPKQVSTMDLDMQDCARCIPAMKDKVHYIFMLHSALLSISQSLQSFTLGCVFFIGVVCRIQR